MPRLELARVAVVWQVESDNIVFINVGSFLVCPNGIVNMTGSTTGTLGYPSSGNYGINETKCWRIEVPKPYRGIGIYFHRYSCLLSVEVSSFLT